MFWIYCAFTFGVVFAFVSAGFFAGVFLVAMISISLNNFI